MKKYSLIFCILIIVSTSTMLFAESWYEKNRSGFPDIIPFNVTGDIILAGSSTVFPLAEELADMFREEGYSDLIEISSIGSGAGFERWAVQAETDISNASRPIKDKEYQSAIRKGRKPLEFLIGTDAISVVVNKRNNWVKNASIEELAKIFTADKWSDVNSKWPNRKILKFFPRNG